MVVKLKKPLTVDGKEIAEVTLDLESLTGADIEFCIHEASASSGLVVVAFEIDAEVHAQIAAKLSGLPRAVFRQMNGRDYQRVMSAVRAFFLDSD